MCGCVGELSECFAVISACRTVQLCILEEIESFDALSLVRLGLRRERFWEADSFLAGVVLCRVKM